MIASANNNNYFAGNNSIAKRLLGGMFSYSIYGLAILAAPPCADVLEIVYTIANLLRSYSTIANINSYTYGDKNFMQ